MAEPAAAKETQSPEAQLEARLTAMGFSDDQKAKLLAEMKEKGVKPEDALKIFDGMTAQAQSNGGMKISANPHSSLFNDKLPDDEEEKRQAILAKAGPMAQFVSQFLGIDAGEFMQAVQQALGPGQDQQAQQQGQGAPATNQPENPYAALARGNGFPPGVSGESAQLNQNDIGTVQFASQGVQRDNSTGPVV